MNLNATSNAASKPLADVEYDFDEVVDRKNSYSMKWGGARMMLTAEEAAADPLPMWVADTDFRSPRPVLDALHAAVEHGVSGIPAARALPTWMPSWVGKPNGLVGKWRGIGWFKFPGSSQR